MTFIGVCAALVMIITGHKPFKNGGAICFRVDDNSTWAGVSLGLVTIVTKSATQHTLNHEFGHTFQNCWWGPLFPFVVAIPSGIRCALWSRIKTKRPDARYDDIWFEGQATELGNKYMESWQ